MTETRSREHTWRIPLWLSAALAVLLMALTIRGRIQQGKSYFDDALMFYRYAMNMRHGLGVSWNLDGMHTYGCTSMTWLLVIWLFSFLPISPVRLVGIASLTTWCVVLAVLVLWMQRRAVSAFLRAPGNTLLLVVFVTEMHFGFQRNIVTGMDTMLALLSHVLIAICALRFVNRQNIPNALFCAVAGFLAYETRPESLLCGLLVPALLWLLARQKKKFAPIAVLLAAEALLVALALVAARAYFHSYVPLAFYLKSKHGYIGYIGYGGPFESLVYFFGYIALPLVIVILLARRSDRAMLVAFGVPTALTVLYLMTVTQIMGWAGRYYVPLIAYALVAALLVLDRALAAAENVDVRSMGKRAALAAICFGLAAVSCGGDLAGHLNGFAAKRIQHPVPLPKVVDAASRSGEGPLPPLDAYVMMGSITDGIAARLPAGSSIAATEVGYLGAFAPQINVYDIAGLNDAGFAMHPFSMQLLLERRPDVIWLPHSDYTGMVAAVLNDPRLLQQYDLYPDAFNFGIAIRKDSPVYAVATQALATEWPKLYPGTKMQDYKAEEILPAAAGGQK